jgi:TPR repeat protein
MEQQQRSRDEERHRRKAEERAASELEENQRREAAAKAAHEAAEEMMTCQVCGGHFVVRDVYNQDGKVVCRLCCEEQAAAEQEMLGCPRCGGVFLISLMHPSGFCKQCASRPAPRRMQHNPAPLKSLLPAPENNSSALRSLGILVLMLVGAFGAYTAYYALRSWQGAQQTVVAKSSVPGEDATQERPINQPPAATPSAADMLHTGLPMIRPDNSPETVQKGLSLLSQSAQLGNAEAAFQLGSFEWNNHQQDSDAVDWFRVAANLGDTRAMDDIGIAYTYGRGVKADDSEAFRWFQKAADQGIADAMNGLGVCYGTGRGVEKDVAKSFEWYQKGAEGGSATAMTNLAYSYANGAGVERNDALALEWFNNAAKAGDPNAAAWLALADYVDARATFDRILANSNRIGRDFTDAMDRRDMETMKEDIDADRQNPAALQAAADRENAAYARIETIDRHAVLTCFDYFIAAARTDEAKEELRRMRDGLPAN